MLEEANGNENIKRREQDSKDIDVQAHEDTNVKRESITTSARTRTNLNKKQDGYQKPRMQSFSSRNRFSAY